MNWSTVALLFFAWQMLSKNNQSSPKLQDIAPFLNDDTRCILDGVAKLSSPTATSEDKTSAIFQMMTNPTIMSFAQNLFGGEQKPTSQTSATDMPPFATSQGTTSQDVFASQQSTPSGTSQSTSFGATPPQTNTQHFAKPQNGVSVAQTPSQKQTNTTPCTTGCQTNIPPQNDEGYTFDSPTERAKQFFAPIDPIATAEVKHKLCYFYDHWYLAK